MPLFVSVFIFQRRIQIRIGSVSHVHPFIREEAQDLKLIKPYFTSIKLAIPKFVCLQLIPALSQIQPNFRLKIECSNLSMLGLHNPIKIGPNPNNLIKAQFK